MLIEKFENIYIAYMQRSGIYGTENKNSWRHLKCILDKKICLMKTQQY